MGYLYAREKMEIKMEDTKELNQATEDKIEEGLDSNDNRKQLRDEFKKLNDENKE